MNKKEIEQQLLAITHDFLSELQAERALQAITLHASLERELGIDSLGKVEIFHRIEKRFGVHLSETAMTEAETLQDLVLIIEKSAPALAFSQTETHTYSAPLPEISLDLSTIQTVGDILLKYATTNPTRPHIYLQNERGTEQLITYGQLTKEAEAVAQGLIDRGIQAGETVAIMLPTSDDFFLFLLRDITRRSGTRSYLPTVSS